MSAEVYIGTSGWNYKHWRGPFYPEDLPDKEMLSFYAEHFDTVEINNTFYHLASFKTLKTWRETVPRKFTFAVKASRFITHMKKLKAPKTSTKKFFTRVERLEDKLGPILFQLPPHWGCDPDRLAGFLDALPSRRRYVFEFRDQSWYTEEVYDLLKKHNAAFCIYELAGKESPLEITADFTYIRLHGPTRAAYAGSYPPQTLKKWARRIKEWRSDLKAIYFYFNNDPEGHAVNNARKLKDMLKG